MFKLVDTFNNRTISRHKTLQAAAHAEVKHDRAVKRTNGSNSYIPTDILDSDGASVRQSEEYIRAHHVATYGS